MFTSTKARIHDDALLDVFGQNPRLYRLYTQLCLCFVLDDCKFDRAEQTDNIVRALNCGLERLITAFPWLNSAVIRGDDGLARLRLRKRPLFAVVRDLSSRLPAIDDFRRAGYPFSLLDETLIAPCMTIPRDEDEAVASTLLIQANFVTGGLLLVIAGQHNTMDMSGQGQVMRLLAKACRCEAFTKEELQVGNASREDVIPLLAEDEIERHQDTSTIKPSLIADEEVTVASVKSTWAYFVFDSSALTALKELANRTKTTSFISTDDVVSAFIWQRVSQARLVRVGNQPSIFERQVNARKDVGLPLDYPGNAVQTVSSTASIQELVAQDLGVIASTLRHTLSEADIDYEFRAAATTLRTQIQNVMSSKTSPRKKPSSTTIKMSSWAKESCYDLDFGDHLGKPGSVRRPAFEAWEGLAYIMPKKLDGELAVALCLRKDDFTRLKSDDSFVKFGSYIG